jgi:hypothetical protein
LASSEDGGDRRDPVRLRLFSVAPFTAVVMPGLRFELLFVASAVVAKRALLAGVEGGNVLAGRSGRRRPSGAKSQPHAVAVGHS